MEKTMLEKPEYFYKKISLNDYILYYNDQERIYVPEEKEEFKLFLKTLFETIKQPTEIQNKNYELILSFPFLLPKNRWDKGLTFGSNYSFDFTWTEIESMPAGWFSAFGIPMLNELKDLFLLKNESFLYQYMITDIKEKWGGLRWYDNGILKGGYEIINKYEKLSYETCIVCGKPGNLEENKSWILPLCIEHKN